MNLQTSLIRQSVALFPAAVHHLHGWPRYIARMKDTYPEPAQKTEGAMARQIYSRCRELYSGEIDRGEFLDAMADIVQEQLTRAFRAALRDNGLDPDLVNQDGEGFKDELEDTILHEYDFVDNLAADVEQAAADGADVGQFQARADLWAARYPDAYNQAQAIISEQMGGKLKWVFGDTEHCATCEALNGIVLYAREWEELGVHPQQPPNELLECGGWRCQCRIEPTDQRRSPRGFETVMNIVNKA